MTISGLMAADRLMHATVGTEFLKLRRSKVVLATFAVYAFMAGMAGFFMWMLMHPGLAESLGLLGQKANFALGGETLDWPTYLRFLAMMAGLGGLLVLSFIVAFVFGREYAEGTAKNMLALPAPRPFFVVAKLIVAAAWFLALNLFFILLGLAVGSLAGLPGFSPALVAPFAAKVLSTALLVLCASSPVAWVAVASRGYFASLGFAVSTLALASVFGHTGWAPWCPWSIIGIYSGAAGPGQELGPGSYAVMAATFLLGTALAIRRELRADNAQ